MTNEHAATQTDRKRRWCRFGLRTMFLALTAFAFLLGLYMDRVRRQRGAVQAIRTTGGEIWYNDPEYDSIIQLQLTPYIMPLFFCVEAWAVAPDRPHWLGRFLGEDFFNHVAGADLSGCANVEPLMPQIAELRGIEILSLFECQVSDDDLRSLKELRTLRVLDLPEAIADDGLAHVANLTQLEALDLSGTKITDEGLVHLQRLRKLRVLDLSGTEITDAGLTHLRGLRQLEALNLGETRVTDEGLAKLKPLTRLELLNLFGTAVGDEGLRHLEDLPNLKYLDAFASRATYVGEKRLREALPNVAVHGIPDADGMVPFD